MVSWVIGGERRERDRGSNLGSGYGGRTVSAMVASLSPNWRTVWSVSRKSLAQREGRDMGRTMPVTGDVAMVGNLVGWRLGAQAPLSICNGSVRMYSVMITLTLMSTGLEDTTHYIEARGAEISLMFAFINLLRLES